MKKGFSIVTIIIGAIMCTYSAIEIINGNIELASKYSPEGSNSNAIILNVIIGLTAIAYGTFNLIIFRKIDDEK